MKKLLGTVITLIIIVVVVSCSKNELTYSCSSEIDSYIKNNIEIFENCNAQALSEFTLGIQKAAYLTYSEDSKYDLWIEHFDAITSDSMFSSSEKQHIQNLAIELSPALFEGDMELFTQFINFYKCWEQMAIDQYNWNTQKLAFVVSSMELNYNSYAESIESSFNSIVALSEGCGCNQTHDFCDGGGLCTGSCTSVSGGCGVLWLEDCNGTCIYQE